MKQMGEREVRTVSTYVITGGTTGIGAAVRKTLLDQGHEVFNIDYKGGDYLADLSTKEGRQGAIEAVFEKYPDGIDVLICNAGVGPTAPPKMIFALNFFASIQLAEGLRPLLKKKRGNCVITSSNSITNMTVRMDWVDMLSNVMDEDRILELADDIPRNQTPSCYSSSKHALARWVRRISPSWAVDGLRINSVAPRQHDDTDDPGYDRRPDGSRLINPDTDTLRAQGIPGRPGDRQWNCVPGFSAGKRHQRSHSVC